MLYDVLVVDDESVIAEDLSSLLNGWFPNVRWWI